MGKSKSKKSRKAPSSSPVREDTSPRAASSSARAPPSEENVREMTPIQHRDASVQVHSQHRDGNSPRHSVRTQSQPRITPETGFSAEEVARAVTVFMEVMRAQGTHIPSNTPPRNQRRRTGYKEGERVPSHKELGEFYEEETWGTENERRKNPQFFNSIRESQVPHSYKSSNAASTRAESSRRDVHERLGGREASLRSRLTFPRGNSPYPAPSRQGNDTASTSLRGRSEAPSSGNRGKAIMIPTSSPFQSWILEERVPTVKIPPHITYDGTSDPKDHIASYEGHMYLNPRSEETW